MQNSLMIVVHAIIDGSFTATFVDIHRAGPAYTGILEARDHPHVIRMFQIPESDTRVQSTDGSVQAFHCKKPFTPGQELERRLHDHGAFQYSLYSFDYW